MQSHTQPQFREWSGETVLNYTGSYKFSDRLYSKYRPACLVRYVVELRTTQSLRFDIQSISDGCQIGLNAELSKDDTVPLLHLMR